MGTCKITTSPGAKHPSLGERHSWLLNNGAGLELKTLKGVELRFDPSMEWELIRDERPDLGPYRVTTRAYRYSLSGPGGIEYVSLHWHPEGNSLVRDPHIHLGAALLSDSSPVTPKAHLPTPRHTFEMAVRWVVEFGVKPACDDWREKLDLAETPHLLYRSWAERMPDA